jgi:hypothetical protein
MKSILSTALAVPALCAALLLPAGAGGAAAADHPGDLSALSSVSTSGTPTDSGAPTGPVDPGTGETPDAKETRVDHAPYVVAAVLILAIAAAALLWRRWGGPSSKPARHGDQLMDEQGDSDNRRTGH